MKLLNVQVSPLVGHKSYIYGFDLIYKLKRRLYGRQLQSVRPDRDSCTMKAN